MMKVYLDEPRRRIGGLTDDDLAEFRRLKLVNFSENGLERS